MELANTFTLFFPDKTIQQTYPELTNSFASTKSTSTELIYCLLNQIAGTICNCLHNVLASHLQKDEGKEESRLHCIFLLGNFATLTSPLKER